MELDMCRQGPSLSFLKSQTRIAILLLAVFLVCLSSAEAQQSQCGKVTGGAILNFAWECWNDSEFLISQPNKADANGWQYVLDGGLADYAGAQFQIYGMAYRETNDDIWVVINSDLPFDTDFPDESALNGSVAYGDMFLNLSGMDFVDAMNAGKLFAIRFDSKNDASVPLGVYKSVIAANVSTANDGPGGRQGYENHIYAFQGVPGYGDFQKDMTYFPLSEGYNVISSGQFLGAVTLLTPASLISEGYDINHFAGSQTVAFKFKKSLIIDDCGVVGGDGSSCRDCSGVACGQAVRDQCGVCGGNGTSCLDCKGTPNGEASIDQCGICGGDGKSCLDCAGSPFGTKVNDRCGVCGGDGNSCLGCTERDITSSLFGLDGSSLRQSQILIKAAKDLLSKAGKSRSNLKFAEAQFNAASDLHMKNWSISWSIPQKFNSCSNSNFCVSVDHSGATTEYIKNADELYNRTLKTVKRIRKLTRSKTVSRHILKTAQNEHALALKTATSIPVSSSACR